MGLPALPQEHVQEGVHRLVECACEDPDLHIRVERQFLSPPYLRDGCLIFNLEGYGRFRLWILDA